MKVWQVVGYKNSGKTTLIEKWIQLAVQAGYKVGAVKHHGHGGLPETGQTSTDSNRHLRAGALAAAVEGGGMLQLHAIHPEWTLSKILHMYSLFSLDFVLIEGYKDEPYPKIIMIRTPSDWEQLGHLQNIIGVIAWQKDFVPFDIPYPLFSLDNEQTYLQWVMNEVEKAR
ncbi:molybdopterin-guanine dinucleotide biosynthesis protein B [Anoxybacillus sp. UARK-01]|uniref:molybdopterin-guanine dinucleotide biosynthesis protein B n=1 Tax=Anoxybacillus sp. UARK-01 TaxID=1895648 RepID=UPI0009BB13AC|nr:molybdopterin-guanine dinucleotide biosynthesis protein B [Anoxybacillus sp. UARK-01]OQM46589.1 molybdopterin-guanine dinucleotide biosynthesis protein B [Anoxybacillus sp. UARK-01]